MSTYSWEGIDMKDNVRVHHDVHMFLKIISKLSY